MIKKLGDSKGRNPANTPRVFPERIEAATVGVLLKKVF